MKELSIEEKAKAYDRVFKEVKDFFEGKRKMYSDVNQTLEYLFSELTESEDEHPQNFWHDAQGDDLPEIDREVIVLCDDGKVCFGHRPVECFHGVSITNYSKVEVYYPERYGKGGWNLPDVKWWLDVEIPKEEQQ